MGGLPDSTETDCANVLQIKGCQSIYGQGVSPGVMESRCNTPPFKQSENKVFHVTNINLKIRNKKTRGSRKRLLNFANKHFKNNSHLFLQDKNQQFVIAWQFNQENV